MKHTPGPWISEQKEYVERTGALRSVFVAQVEDGKPGGRICEAFSNCLANADACCANARLIAAAPDLLAALEYALAAMQVIGDEFAIHAQPFDKACNDVENMNIAAQKFARAAIKKATDER